ncbi:MAG TPA: hypothetical protein VIL35_16925 [Vicinamibacterales bacterium]
MTPIQRNPGAKGPFVVRCAFTAIALALLVPACTGSVPLTATHDSPEAVARAVVAALSRRDRAALRGLAVGEEEFRFLVWPRQPAARPERNIPWDYVWKDLSAKSEYQLRRLLATWRGHGAEPIAVTFEGRTTDYGTYRIHRRSVVTLRDANGQTRHVRLFGSLIEQDGRWKVFSYVID